MRDGLRRRMVVAAGTALALRVAAREARHGTGIRSVWHGCTRYRRLARARPGAEPGSWPGKVAGWRSAPGTRPSSKMRGPT